MSFEDLVCMDLDKMEQEIKKLLVIAQAVAILGEGVPISRKLADAARKFM